MKVVILLAFCLAAAMAVPASSPTQSLNPLEALKAKFQPKLEILKDRKRLLKLLENPPGLKEVWEQFDESLYAISDIVWALPAQLVPIFEKTGLQSQLEEKLPAIAEQAGLTVYKDTKDYIDFWKSYYEDYIGVPYPPETMVEDFIMVGTLHAFYEVPSATAKQTRELISQRNVDAGDEFAGIINSGVDNGINEVDKFFAVLEEALAAASKKSTL